MKGGVKGLCEGEQRGVKGSEAYSMLGFKWSPPPGVKKFDYHM